MLFKQDQLNTNSRLSGSQIVETPENADEKVENAYYNGSNRVESPDLLFTKPEKLDIVLLVAFRSVLASQQLHLQSCSHLQ